MFFTENTKEDRNAFMRKESFYRNRFSNNHSYSGNCSSFAYPDPYEMDPSQVMYLGEDGDLLEDL